MKIYTDGSYDNNKLMGGWAFVVIDGNNTIDCFGYLTNGVTASYCELVAVMEALSFVREPTDITIYTDCLYVETGLNGAIYKWRSQGWRSNKGQKLKNIKLWKKILRLMNHHNVIAKHVKSHSGDEYNTRADTLCVAARKAKLFSRL